MAQRGGLSHIHYKETKGLKTASGQFVTAGTILTRQGDRWKAGLNVSGCGTLYAKIDGTVYFSHKRSGYRKDRINTLINISPVRDQPDFGLAGRSPKVTV